MRSVITTASFSALAAVSASAVQTSFTCQETGALNSPSKHPRAVRSGPVRAKKRTWDEMFMAVLREEMLIIPDTRTRTQARTRMKAQEGAVRTGSLFG